MNRNILWQKDVQAAQAALAPAGVSRPAREGEPEKPPVVPPPDSRSERIVKFIPGEAMGLYVFLESVSKGFFTPKPTPGAAEAVAASSGQIQLFLWLALGIALVFNYFYLLWTWKVQRLSQRLVSCLALLVYVFAAGGAFATYAWYQPGYGAFALGVVGAFLIFAPEPPGPPLPPEQVVKNGNAAGGQG
jgi:hypothetical protein